MTPKLLSPEETEAHLDAMDRAGFVVVVLELRAHIAAQEADKEEQRASYEELHRTLCRERDEHAKALVRARNEGLERAKEAVRTALTAGLLTSGQVTRALAEIDAMKEDEG